MTIKKGKMTAVALLLQMGLVLGSHASTVMVSDDLAIDIPLLLYKGDHFSAKMEHNGSCWVATDLTPVTVPSENQQTATVTHNGFDFSTGNDSPEWEQTDFYLTAWANTAYPQGYEWGSGIWANTYEFNQIHVVDQGQVELSSVTEIPTDWSVPEGAVDYPLQVGHVYILRARDGFAKFKVLSLSPTGTLTADDIGSMQIEIEYVYTEGNSF